MPTAAAVRKQPRFLVLSHNGVEIHGQSTWDSASQTWETSLTAVRGSKVVGVYDTSTWTVKVAGKVVKPVEAVNIYETWLAALRSL